MQPIRKKSENKGSVLLIITFNKTEIEVVAV